MTGRSRRGLGPRTSGSRASGLGLSRLGLSRLGLSRLGLSRFGSRARTSLNCPGCCFASRTARARHQGKPGVPSCSLVEQDPPASQFKKKSERSCYEKSSFPISTNTTGFFSPPLPAFAYRACLSCNVKFLLLVEIALRFHTLKHTSPREATHGTFMGRVATQPRRALSLVRLNNKSGAIVPFKGSRPLAHVRVFPTRDLSRSGSNRFERIGDSTVGGRPSSFSAAQHLGVRLR